MKDKGKRIRDKVRIVLFLSFILYPFAFVWADCLLLPIIGNGSDSSPYRPAIPPGIEGVAGANWSAHIPSNPNGSPQFPDTYVCFPASFRLPPGIASKAIPPADVAAAILIRDPKADLKAMTPPPAVIKGSWRDYRDRAVRFARVKLGAALAWATSATDNFNRADGGLGANWSSGYGSEGTATIVSNAAQCAIGARCVGSYNAFTPGADQYAQGVVAQYYSIADGDAGVAVRMPAPTSFDGYFARAGRFQANGPGSTTLSKRIAGANTALAADTTFPVWTTPAGTDVIRLEVVGTGLTLKRNGVSILTAPGDTVNLLTGRGGILLNSLNAANSSDTARLDDFEVGDLGGAAATRRRVVVVQ